MTAIAPRAPPATNNAILIKPASKPFCRSSLRRSFPSLEWFGSRDEAKVLMRTWRRHFNEVRPHSSLGYMTPNEFVASITTNAPTARRSGPLRCVASALRCAAQPLREGQKQKAEVAACSN
jgi:hypothetical protein